MVRNHVRQLRRGALLLPVTHTPCQKDKGVRIDRGDDEIVRLPTGQTQGIDQTPQKHIGVMQRLVGCGADNLRLGESLQRCERMRRTQRRDGGAVAQLEILHRVFNIHQATLAVFGVNGAWRDQLMALALAQMHGCLQRKRLGTVDKGIAQGFDGLSEGWDHQPPSAV